MYDTATIESEVITVELERICPTCGEMRVAPEYQDTVDGPVFESCRMCRQVPEPASAAQIAQVRTFGKRLAAEARGEHIESPHITEINAEMHRLFGGFKRFCALWHDQIEIAMVDNAGSKLVLDQFKEIVRLTKSATEFRDSAPDIATLTDEELGVEMWKLAMKVMPVLPKPPIALEGPDE